MAAATSGAQAQPAAGRPVTLIVPFPAGGGVDALARIVAERLAAHLAQQVIIDNRGGVAGVIGMRVAAKAAPDGATIVMSHTGITSINPTLYANPGYDPKKDFAPIGLIATTPIVLMTNAASPVHTVGDLIALAKREPGKLDVGTPPPGTGGYLSAELFKAAAGIDYTVVTYKGTGPLTNDLLGGHIPIAFNVLAPAMGNLQAGTLRAIATAGPTRLPQLPDLPTIAEFRAARLRGGAPLRPDGARRHAAGRHRQVQRGASRNTWGSRGQGAHRRRRRRYAPVDARGIRRRHRQGGAEVVGPHQEARPAGGLRSVSREGSTPRRKSLAAPSRCPLPRSP